MIQFTTSSGSKALAAAMLGDELRFTKIIIGSGYMPDGIERYAITDVVEQIDTRPIIGSSINKDDRTVTTVFTLTNKGRNDGFYFREIGVYAHTETTGEILFTYYNAEDQAEYIPAEGGIKAVERTIAVTNAIWHSEKVSILIDSMQTAPIYLVEEANAAARNALDIANQANEREITCPDGGCPALQALKTQIERLERGMYDKIDSNAFRIDFYTLTGKTMTAGVWNQAAGRLEC